MKDTRRLQSGRVSVRQPDQVTADRYQFLDLASAEPNLGTAGNGSVLTTTVSGQRLWTANISIDNATLSGNLTANAIYTENLFFSNGQPFVSGFVGSGGGGGGNGATNIYNGRVMATNTSTLIDSINSAGITSVRWVLSASDTINDAYRTSTIDSSNDGFNIYYNEFGVVLSNPNIEVASYFVEIDNGIIKLYATGSSVNVPVTFQRTTLGSSTTVGNVDGAGVIQSTVGSGTATVINVDNFLGTGIDTAYTLSVTPSTKNQTLIAVGGIVQPKTTYSLSGDVINFSSPPPSGAPVEIQTFVTTTVTGYTGSGGTGYTGSAGAGYTGSSGSLGYTGSIGVGYTGSVGAGYTGSRGDTGFVGSMGLYGSSYAILDVALESAVQVIQGSKSTPAAEGFTTSADVATNTPIIVYNQGSGTRISTTFYRIYLYGVSNCVFYVYQSGSQPPEEDLLVEYSKDGITWSTMHTVPYTGIANDTWVKREFAVPEDAKFPGGVLIRVVQNSADGPAVDIWAFTSILANFVGPRGYTGSGGIGYVGSQGTAGYTGSAATGVVGYSGSAGGAAINGNLNVGGDIFVTGNILPTSNNTVNLGSPTNRFNKLYIAAQTIDLGGQTVITSDVAGQLQFITTVGNVSLTANSINFLQTVANSTTASGDITTIGNIVASQNLTVAGNLTVQGNTIVVNSENFAVLDSTIAIHTPADLSPLTSNDGRDIGITLHYYDTGDKQAFFGRKNSNNRLVYYQDATEVTGNTFTGTPGSLEVGSVYADSYFYANGTPYFNTGYTGSIGPIGYTGSAGVGGGGGGAAMGLFTRADIDGTLTVFNGTRKFYSYGNVTVSKIQWYVQTAPVGSAANVRINVNGSPVANLSLSSGSVYTIQSNLAIAINEGDYITTDITSIGSTFPGADGTIQLITG